jgi:hypothetical protein
MYNPGGADLDTVFVPDLLPGDDHLACSSLSIDDAMPGAHGLMCAGTYASSWGGGEWSGR